MKFSKHLIAVATAAAILAPATASATNGYFSLGYGSKSRGIAGASTALSQDTYAAAVNPAGMAQAAGTNDVGVTIFSPVREGETGASGGGQIRSDSGSNGFIIPSGGFVRKLNDEMTWGMSIYANGGMNTDYDHDVTVNVPDGSGGFNQTDGNLFGYPNQGLGVDLAQLIFAPTITYALNKNHTVGASLLVGYQQFKARGLQGFCGLKGDMTCNPNTGAGVGSAAANKGLTNQGYDSAWGTGLRVGWQGKLSDNVSVGAAYSTKIYMDEFGKYDKLFAEKGDFDIPANWSIGIAGKVTPKTTVSADIQHIMYSDVKSIANTGPSLTGTGNAVFKPGSGVLGADNGLGFGWDDVTVFKIGAIYEHNTNFTYRFGYAHSNQPIGKDELAFNILAPAVIEDHVTAGFTYRPNGKDNQQITFTFMHAIEANESGAFPAAFGGGRTNLQMYQNAFDFQYTWTY